MGCGEADLGPARGHPNASGISASCVKQDEGPPAERTLPETSGSQAWSGGPSRPRESTGEGQLDRPSARRGRIPVGQGK